MSILESLELALKNIVSSKVRTLLTMLGIIIGVAAVIVIVGLGNGLEGYVTESFSDMGTNTLTVTVMSRGSTRSLDVEDMYDIVEENSEYLDLCSPTVTMAGYVKIGSETVDTTTSTGVSEDYLDIARLTIAQGRNLQYSDMSTRAKVCVIGAYLNQAYFGGNAVGQTLRVGGQSLEIVGVLAGIAAISLVVGGIGIMNIMLVSVTERTREIGIRKSLGAKRRDIRSQFVIEAGTTSAIGGLLGIALGCLLAMGVGSLIGAMLTSQMGGGATFSATPTLGAVAISFGVSVGIGVLFGYLPANKAAKLNPIDALRYD